jgi:hypothetical protein
MSFEIPSGFRADRFGARTKHSSEPSSTLRRTRVCRSPTSALRSDALLASSTGTTVSIGIALADTRRLDDRHWGRERVVSSISVRAVPTLIDGPAQLETGIRSGPSSSISSDQP